MMLYDHTSRVHRADMPLLLHVLSVSVADMPLSLHVLSVSRADIPLSQHVLSVSRADIQESWHILYGTIGDMPRRDKENSYVLAGISLHQRAHLPVGVRFCDYGNPC